MMSKGTNAEIIGHVPGASGKNVRGQDYAGLETRTG